MPGQINLGNNYTVEEDSNGDLVITDSGGSTVLKHDDSSDSFAVSESFDALEANQINNDSGLTDSQISVGRQTPIIEDWERQSLDYYGNNSGYVIDTSTALQGSASVRNDQTGFNNGMTSPFRALRGVRYRGYFRFDLHSSQSGQGLRFGIGQSKNTFLGDGYSARIFKNEEAVQIERRDSGSGSILASESGLSIPTDQWLVVEFDLGFKNIKLDVKKLNDTSILSSQLTANDTTHQSDGYFQLQMRSDESNKYTYFDVIERRPI